MEHWTEGKMELEVGLGTLTFENVDRPRLGNVGEDDDNFDCEPAPSAKV